MFERKHIRWISWILIIALLISGDFLGNPVSERTSAAENPVSYRNVIYTLDENNHRGFIIIFQGMRQWWGTHPLERQIIRGQAMAL